MKPDTLCSAAFWQTPAITEELIQLLMTLCSIPAPSGSERNRARFISDWLRRECGLDSTLDSADNVLVSFMPDPFLPAIPPIFSKLTDRLTEKGSVPGEMASNGDISLLEPQAPAKTDPSGFLLYMAHTDTVFPDLTPLPVIRTDTRICSPGAGDDTACVAILMMFLKYGQAELKKSRNPLLFAFNSCEEGLGNLKGSRQIMKDYAGRIKEVTSFDGGVNGICNRAVGSLRYQITIQTKGGHSYNDFGCLNAIQVMACLIERLYRLPLPANGRNTCNAGTITGGTSVNTIAQSCQMLFEYRSDVKQSLAHMQLLFFQTLEQLKTDFPDILLDCVLVGERPCMGDVDPAKLDAMTKRALASLQSADALFKKPAKTTAVSAFAAEHIPKSTDSKDASGAGRSAAHPESSSSDVPCAIGSGSTDCNIPLSQGIPAICFGGLLGGGVHTREEYVTISSLLLEAAAISHYILSEG